LQVDISDSPATVKITFDPTAITAYGGLYSDLPQNFVFAGAGEVAQIALGDTMPSFNTVLGSNAVQIVFTGDYEVNFMIRIRALSAASVFAGVRVGSTSFIPSTYQTSPLSLTEVTAFQGSIITALNSGDSLNLALVAAGPSSIDLAANVNASLSVKRLMLTP
jgi:hypothetical protein